MKIFQSDTIVAALLMSIPLAWCQQPQCQDTSGECAIQGNDATCTFLESGDTVSGCRTVTCAGMEDCREASIVDSRTVECTADSACYQATISNSHSLECSDRDACGEAQIQNVNNLSCIGDDSCRYAIISNVPKGATIDCDTQDEDGDTCKQVTITSSNPFQLTCQSQVDYNSLACSDSSITNPGGAVFCYGGVSWSGGMYWNGACDGLDIDGPLGCLICGSDYGCSDVSFVDSDGNTQTVNGELYVDQNCKVSDVLDYMNKLHQDGGTACQDNEGNDGDCDVVEAYCANNPQDANCVEEFQLQNNGKWRKTEIPETMNAVDPDSLESGSSDDDDKVSRESWVVGSIVIAFFLLLVIMAIWCMCHKKPVSGGKGRQEADAQSSAVAHHEETNSSQQTEKEHVENV